MRSILIFFFIFYSLIWLRSYSQDVGFEIIIDKENAIVAPGQPIQNKYDDIICPVTFSILSNDSIVLRYSRVFSISQDGDTNSVLFYKPDTLFNIETVCEINTGEGGYLFWCTYYDKNQGPIMQIDVFIRTDYSLNIVWEHQFNFGFTYAASGRKFLMTLHDEFLFACSPLSTSNMYLLKLSNLGDSTAYRYYEGDSAGSVQSLTYSYDSTKYFLHVHGAHEIPGVIENTIIILNTDLDQESVIHYPEWYDMSYESVLWPGNKIVSAGDEAILSSGIDRYFTAYVFDENLNILKKKQLTNPDTNSTSAWYQNMDILDTSFIYVGGSFSGHFHSSLDTSWYYIAMLDHNLELVYEKYIGGDMHYWCECITATSDGGVLMTGSIFDVNVTPVRHKAYIVKLDTTNLPVNIQQPTYLQFYDALVYPNPGSDVLNIRTTLKNAWIQLYDINGRPIFRQELNKHITQINTNHLPGGTYIYTIGSNEQQVQSGKWIKN
jgi:hypothetical protein